MLRQLISTSKGRPEIPEAIFSTNFASKCAPLSLRASFSLVQRPTQSKSLLSLPKSPYTWFRAVTSVRHAWTEKQAEKLADAAFKKAKLFIELKQSDEDKEELETRINRLLEEKYHCIRTGEEPSLIAQYVFTKFQLNKVPFCWIRGRFSLSSSLETLLLTPLQHPKIDSRHLDKLARKATQPEDWPYIETVYDIFLKRNHPFSTHSFGLLTEAAVRLGKIDQWLTKIENPKYRIFPTSAFVQPLLRRGMRLRVAGGMSPEGFLLANDPEYHVWLHRLLQLIRFRHIDLNPGTAADLIRALLLARHRTDAVRFAFCD